MILPFVSIVAEKAKYLSALLEGLNVQVKHMYGGRRVVLGPPGAPEVIVATLEKANGLVNRMVEEGRVSELGCVVVDEVFGVVCLR